MSYKNGLVFDTSVEASAYQIKSTAKKPSPSSKQNLQNKKLTFYSE
jgi:hypothetical protein